MNRGLFYLHYALRSLRREGVRTLLAGLSIAFGVLSLVAMQSLSGTLLDGSLFDQRLQYGGDARIQPPNWGESFTQAELAQIEAWQGQGIIDRYTPISDGTALYLRTPTSGRVTFVMNTIGFDPANYPLAGELTLRDPAGKSSADVLIHRDDTLITRDLADSLGLRVGDTILISGGDVTPARLTVAGIINATPNQQGKSLLYTLETARMLENRADVITSISALWGDYPNAAQTVIDSPMQVYVAGDREQALQSSGAALFDVMLKGAGVLGLLVGGLGVSNTLQVILARRRLEIAMLKTLGFKNHHLLTLIGLETGLLGIISSVIGVLAGAAVASRLLSELGGVGTFMIDWSPDPRVMLGGVLAGSITAVVFGLQTILASSATRPVELLRDLPTKTPSAVLAARGVLFALLILLFGALVGLVLGSMLHGIAYVIGGGLLLLALRGIFWLVLWAALKIPLPPLPMLRMARANLNSRKAQSSLVVIALFAGTFAVTFAAISIYNAQVTVMGQRASDEGYNLMVFTSASDAPQVAEQVRAQGANGVYIRYLVNGAVNDEPMTIEGRAVSDFSADLLIESAWDGSPNTVLLPTAYQEWYALGDTVTLEANGLSHTVEIAGFYETVGSYETNLANVPNGAIVAPETALMLGGERIEVNVIASFPLERLNATTDALGLALPDALVFSKADINNLLVMTYQSLFTFAVSVAGLAFVAGAVLIANAAGLTVVERRREIGVFKAVGYTSGHVLRLLLGEYGVLGLLAGVFGSIAVIILITVINLAEPGANMIIEPVIITVMVLISTGIAIGSAALVAWQPTHVRPLDVLRYE